MRNQPPGEDAYLRAAAAPLGVRRWLAVCLGTGLGAGFFPVAPGTAGTLVPGLPLAWALGRIGPWAGLAAAGLLFIAGLWAAGACERIWNRRDPPGVVIDEVVGVLLAVAWLEPSWQRYLAGFVLFRVADILKPWPAGLADRRLPGGLGIMLDDVISGVYARAALEVLLRTLPGALP